LNSGRPAEAERWADMVDRWQHQDAPRADDPSTETWAAVLRAILCRHGVEQMRADADEAVRKLAAENIVAPVGRLLQGIASILCGDLDGAGASLKDAVSAAEEVGAHENLAFALCERSLVAMTRGEWRRAEALAGQAGTVLHRAGIEDSLATPMICAVQARAAMRRGDVPAARHELVGAQRLRHLLTYAIPYLAVQVRIELIRVHVALADLAGARTLMQEIDELFERRPGLGTLVEEAESLRGQLAKERGSYVPGASALTAAELRLLPLLSTHLSVPEIAAELFLSPHTIKSQMKSIYRKLDASTRNRVVTRSRDLGLLEG
jgi:LuxR family transcriptional regulator, maltose regulon positive regulatory protein